METALTETALTETALMEEIVYKMIAAMLHGDSSIISSFNTDSTAIYIVQTSQLVVNQFYILVY